MEYLEQNRQIIAEIREMTKLTVGVEIGRGTQSEVISLGYYNSKLLGRPLHLAAKKINLASRIHYAIVAKELGIIRQIEKRFPHLLPELPVVHGLLVDLEGKERGIITEDFSQGQSYEVYAMHERDTLPTELRDAFGNKIDLDDLATTCFQVNGKRRIGDFGEFSMRVPTNEWEAQFQYRDIMDRLDEFTVTK